MVDGENKEKRGRGRVRSDLEGSRGSAEGMKDAWRWEKRRNGIGGDAEKKDREEKARPRRRSGSVRWRRGGSGQSWKQGGVEGGGEGGRLGDTRPLS